MGMAVVLVVVVVAGVDLVKFGFAVATLVLVVFASVQGGIKLSLLVCSLGSVSEFGILGGLSES
jgi:hypothetical protein